MPFDETATLCIQNNLFDNHAWHHSIRFAPFFPTRRSNRPAYFLKVRTFTAFTTSTPTVVKDALVHLMRYLIL